jgi:very-short-patch-repair endonuclease
MLVTCNVADTRENNGLLQKLRMLKGGQVRDLEETLMLLIRDAGLPEPVRQYRFDKVRRFKLDFAWPDLKLGVEVNGGTWVKSGHTTGGGLDRD